MKKIITGVENKIQTIRDSFQAVRNRPILWLLVGMAGFAVGDIAHMAFGKAAQLIFPQLDDANQIIANQNQQFANVKANLDKLESKLSGADKTQFESLRDAIKAASSGSDSIATRLTQLIDENKNLRTVLKREKGIEGGVDLLVPMGEGYKIDATTTLGFNNFNGTALLSLSSLNSTETVNVWKAPGQALPFTNDSGKTCNITFLGASQADGSARWLGKFAMQCKDLAAQQKSNNV